MDAQEHALEGVRRASVSLIHPGLPERTGGAESRTCVRVTTSGSTASFSWALPPPAASACPPPRTLLTPPPPPQLASSCHGATPAPRQRRVYPRELQNWQEQPCRLCPRVCPTQTCLRAHHASCAPARPSRRRTPPTTNSLLLLVLNRFPLAQPTLLQRRRRRLLSVSLLRPRRPSPPIRFQQNLPLPRLASAASTQGSTERRAAASNVEQDNVARPAPVLSAPEAPRSA